jgi:glycosyltransferase involved in cell wall biosynthesis
LIVTAKVDYRPPQTSRRSRAACYHQFLISRELGGAGLVALHLAHHVQDSGHATQVWLPGEGAALQEAERLGLPTQRYRFAQLASPSRVRAALGNWVIGRALRRLGSGVAHVHSPHLYGMLRWGLRWSGLKRVVHVQLKEGAGGLRWAFKHPPELIITCARFLVDQVRRTLPAPHQEGQPIVAVPNAVDLERFHPGDKRAAKKRVGAPGHVPLVLMLANLAPHKGQETSIRAVALLKRQGIDVVCWLAGSERGGTDAFTGRLRALIRELGVQDRVRLLGQRGDAPDLLRAADLFVLPSTNEGLPLSILEAQATKVPVLAAPTAGIPEAIEDGETGLLIAAEDAPGYAAQLARLLANPGLYHALAERAFARTAREYNWKTCCERIWALYQEVMEGPR